MDAPTTAQEIKTAYKELYRATAYAMDAQCQVNAARNALKDAEWSLRNECALDAGENADARTAIMAGLTSPERAELRRAEDDLAAAEREQALAKIAVNELRELLRLAEYIDIARLAEWEAGRPYYTED